MVRFLIIRFSSIGDIVLTSPVIRCIKAQVEGAEIHFLTKKQYAPILENNPFIDKVHVLDNDFSDLIYELKQEGFDYVIDLHNNLRSKKIIRRLLIISFSFNKLNREKWLLTNLKINKLPDLHIVDRYLETTKVFDVKNDNKGLNYFISETDKVDISKLPELFHQKYIACVIGAQHNTKKLPIDKWIELCKKTPCPVIILGGSGDRDMGEEISAAIGERAYNACGKYTLNQSASLIQQASLVITHDTGLMHIAAAFKKRIISLWGNTIPEFGMYPYLSDPASQIIEVKDLKCRPCTKIGFSRCPKKHFDCMNNIDIEGVAEKIRGMVE